MRAKPLRRLTLGLLVSVPLVVVGCSRDSGSSLPITEAPATWEPPAECYGVGNSCAPDSEGPGCQAPDSACQQEGAVCVPSQAGRSRTASTPYCTALTCMTYEEASCFCTGEAGSERGDCESPSQLADLCGGEADLCAGQADCCDGYACLTDSSSAQKACRKTCETGNDCSTGCCTDSLNTGTKICSSQDECNDRVCRDVICVSGQTCVNSEVNDFAGCQDVCESDADCDSGCCKLFSDGISGFCAEARYCSCILEGDACGTPGIGCCDGGVCAGSSGNYSCKVACESDADCGDGCCYSLSDGITLVCGEC